MQPNTPPAPPPITPQGGNNPYDFITNPGAPKKKKLGLPSGSSKGSRILVIVIGFILLIGLGTMTMSLLGSGAKKNIEQLVTVAQEQTELIRVSDIGIKKARTAEAKNLAMTTKLTLTSQQPAMSDAVKKLGGKLDSKTLALGKNTKTDQLLTQAEQANNFDEVFLKKLREDLLTYAQDVKTAYQSNPSKKTKDALEQQFKNAAILADYKE